METIYSREDHPAGLPASTSLLFLALAAAPLRCSRAQQSCGAAPDQAGSAEAPAPGTLAQRPVNSPTV